MKKNKWQIFLITAIITLTIIGFSLRIDATKAQTTTISDDLALDIALSLSRDNRLGGWLSSPEKAYGQVMIYDDAVRFVFGKPIDPNTEQYKKRDEIVWLIVLEGEFIEHVPPSAGGDIPAKEVIHNQMVIILDGKTGDIMRRVWLSPQIKLPVTNLPVLQKADKELSELPTSILISTDAPYPTLAMIELPTELPVESPTETPTPTETSMP